MNQCHSALINADSKVLHFSPLASIRSKPRHNLCQIYLVPLFLSHILGGYYFVENRSILYYLCELALPHLPL